MSFEFDISEKDIASAEFMSRVHRVLKREMIKAAKERKISRSELARLLEVDRSVISRALNGKSNLTIRTISDICWGLGLEPSFDACLPSSEHGCNHVADANSHRFVSSSQKGPWTEVPFGEGKKAKASRPRQSVEYHYGS